MHIYLQKLLIDVSKVSSEDSNEIHKELVISSGDFNCRLSRHTKVVGAFVHLWRWGVGVRLLKWFQCKHKSWDEQGIGVVGDREFISLSREHHIQSYMFSDNTYTFCVVIANIIFEVDLLYTLTEL